jgi:predicted HD phosphohydrolase
VVRRYVEPVVPGQRALYRKLRANTSAMPAAQLQQAFKCLNSTFNSFTPGSAPIFHDTMGHTVGPVVSDEELSMEWFNEAVQECGGILVARAGAVRAAICTRAHAAGKVHLDESGKSAYNRLAKRLQRAREGAAAAQGGNAAAS